MKFNNLEITEEMILKTREWYISNRRAVILEIQSEKYFVNDKNEAIKFELNFIDDITSGKCDDKPYFLQKAYFIHTKESIPLGGCI